MIKNQWTTDAIITKLKRNIIWRYVIYPSLLDNAPNYVPSWVRYPKEITNYIHIQHLLIF